MKAEFKNTSGLPYKAMILVLLQQLLFHLTHRQTMELIPAS